MASKQEKWEYNYYHVVPDGRSRVERLNEFGQEGWEIVSLEVANTGIWYVFMKRRIK